MARLSQALIEQAEYVCISCNGRDFDSEQALLQHCRNARCHQGEWCERCKWLFVSPTAREQHIRNSHRHWVCLECRVDELDRADLQAHMEVVHSICYDCQRSFTDIEQHRLEEHYQCRTCKEQFQDENQVLMVR